MFDKRTKEVEFNEFEPLKILNCPLTKGYSFTSQKNYILTFV